MIFMRQLKRLKPLKCESNGLSTTVLIACGTESGYIELLHLLIHHPPIVKCECNLVSKFQLPNNKTENQPSIYTSMEFHEELNILVEGTISEPIYLMKLHTDANPDCLKPLAKKTLPSAGVASMSLDEKKDVLAIGSHEGTLRTYFSPDEPHLLFCMSLRASHHLNSLPLVEDKHLGQLRSFLVCASSTGIISF